MIKFLTYIRAIVMTPVMALHTAVLSVLAIISGGLGLTKMANWVTHTWAAGILWMFGVSVNIHGKDNIPVDRGVLYLFNHQSFFDIFALHGSLKHTVRFGAKIELFSIPIFGAAMRAVGALPIARENRSEVMKVYQAAEKKFKSGWSFILAPEGTRQSEPQIGRFKKGPFIFAINAQAPIVPVVIRGSYDVFPKHAWGMNLGKWRRTIDVAFLPLFETAGLTVESCPELLERVRAAMVEAYAKLTAKALTK